MTKKFYEHLVSVESLVVELDSLELSHHQKMHLSKLVDSNIENVILHAMLDHLSEGDKKIFIEHLKKGDHGNIWKFLNEKIDAVEEKIKVSAEKLKEELHKDIKISKKLKGKSQK